MKLVIIIGLITSISGIHPLNYQYSQDDLSDEFISNINKHQSSWKAGRNFEKNTPIEYLKKLLGAFPNNNLHILPQLTPDHNLQKIDISETFDARDKWPNCPTIKEIRDQGGCGSCWAIAAVEAMSDRVCIHSSGNINFHFSTEDLLSCCVCLCDGCNGGDPSTAWFHWVNKGIVSGGEYSTRQGCRPYSIAPCDHNLNETSAPCNAEVPTPNCTKSCQSAYPVTYKEDRHFGKRAYNLSDDEKFIQYEIMQNGPVEATLAVYLDFFYYKRGVYQHVSGTKLGYHSVKLLGWGIENNIPYWLAANSFNSNWGEDGYFKILRGKDHCGIESRVVAGMPI